MGKNRIVNILVVTLLLLLLSLVLWIFLYPSISIRSINNESRETLGNPYKRKQIEQNRHNNAVLLDFEHGEWIAIYSKKIYPPFQSPYLYKSFALDSNGVWYESESSPGGWVLIRLIRSGMRSRQQLIEAEKLKQLKEMYSEYYNNNSPIALGLCDDFREAKELLIKKLCFKKVTVR